MRRAVLLASLVAITVVVPARADDAGAPDSGAPAVETDAGAASDCVERIPPGATRPELTDTFPSRAGSGWAALLSITVKHGRGERVLPAGLENAATSEAKKRLKAAGFALPAQEGVAAGQIWVEGDASSATVTSHVELPLVALPAEPGRHILQLPALPIAVARANGEVMSLCTRPHWITVEDPIANEPDAKPKPNPPGRPQREEWTALRNALQWTAIGLVLAALGAWLYRWWRARPVPLPPPPPPRPPWEVALEKLAAVRAGSLLEEGRHGEYIDLVSDAVRGYLGARFGFDGLESTTDEILAALRVSSGGFIRQDRALREGEPALSVFGAGLSFRDVEEFLGQADLVKFAGMRPTTEQCEKALASGERIVRATMPVARASEPRSTRDLDGGAS